MSDESAMRGVLSFPFPIWTVALASTVKAKGLVVEAFGKYGSKQTGSFFPLFTNNEMAIEFLRDYDAPIGVLPLALKTPKALRKLLLQLEKSGIQNVGLDISKEKKKPKGTATGRWYPIRKFISGMPPDPQNN